MQKHPGLPYGRRLVKYLKDGDLISAITCYTDAVMVNSHGYRHEVFKALDAAAASDD